MFSFCTIQLRADDNKIVVAHYLCATADFVKIATTISKLPKFCAMLALDYMKYGSGKFAEKAGAVKHIFKIFHARARIWPNSFLNFGDHNLK